MPPHLLSLPAELRNLIYTLVFSDHTHISDLRKARLNTSSTSRVHLEAELSQHNNLGLLLTCRQIHDEASSLAFSLTTFFTTRAVLKSMLSVYMPGAVSQKKLALVTSITIVLDSPLFSKWFDSPWACDSMRRHFNARVIRCMPLKRNAFLGLDSLKEVRLLFVRYDERFPVVVCEPLQCVSSVLVGEFLRRYRRPVRKEVRFEEKRPWDECGLSFERVVGEEIVDKMRTAGFLLGWDEKSGDGKGKRATLAIKAQFLPFGEATFESIEGNWNA